jgi:hypothetical protein
LRRGGSQGAADATYETCTAEGGLPGPRGPHNCGAVRVETPTFGDAWEAGC